MSKLQIAKKVIEDNFSSGDCGLFDTRNLVGDPMEMLYNKDGLRIDICRSWSYFEVFGLSDEEFESLGKFYVSLGSRRRR